ncbi:MAG: glutamate racemase [Gemmatimonadetes bacterium]|nr:glutamate racemase [Gemmatimonadota bacterium]
MNDAPIGVFDSGVGGLTVAHAIRQRLPHEALIYVGDTARVPYGPKSPDTVRRYAQEIADWLVGQGVKLVVVACNTATAHALDTLRATLRVPVIGVIEPGARAAVAADHDGHIGVIGTTGTVASGAYERAIRALAPSVTVTARACPLFVPLVEEGWLDGDVTEAVARRYLQPLVDDHVDAVVLGCTHYPLLKPVLARTLGPAVILIDSAEETARETERVLEARALAAAPRPGPRLRVVVTDAPAAFLRQAERFLGEPLDGVETLALA